jgi:hypothetical protein
MSTDILNLNSSPVEDILSGLRPYELTRWSAHIVVKVAKTECGKEVGTRFILKLIISSPPFSPGKGDHNCMPLCDPVKIDFQRDKISIYG